MKLTQTNKWTRTHVLQCLQCGNTQLTGGQTDIQLDRTTDGRTDGKIDKYVEILCIFTITIFFNVKPKVKNKN